MRLFGVCCLSREGEGDKFNFNIAGSFSSIDTYRFDFEPNILIIGEVSESEVKLQIAGIIVIVMSSDKKKRN